MINYRGVVFCFVLSAFVALAGCSSKTARRAVNRVSKPAGRDPKATRCALQLNNCVELGCSEARRFDGNSRVQPLAGSLL